MPKKKDNPKNPAVQPTSPVLRLLPSGWNRETQRTDFTLGTPCPGTPDPLEDPRSLTGASRQEAVPCFSQALRWFSDGSTSELRDSSRNSSAFMMPSAMGQGWPGASTAQSSSSSGLPAYYGTQAAGQVGIPVALIPVGVAEYPCGTMQPAMGWTPGMGENQRAVKSVMHPHDEEKTLVHHHVLLVATLLDENKMLTRARSELDQQLRCALFQQARNQAISEELSHQLGQERNQRLRDRALMIKLQGELQKCKAACASFSRHERKLKPDQKRASKNPSERLQRIGADLHGEASSSELGSASEAAGHQNCRKKDKIEAEIEIAARLCTQNQELLQELAAERALSAESQERARQTARRIGELERHLASKDAQVKTSASCLRGMKRNAQARIKVVERSKDAQITEIKENLERQIAQGTQRNEKLKLIAKDLGSSNQRLSAELGESRLRGQQLARELRALELTVEYRTAVDS